MKRRNLKISPYLNSLLKRGLDVVFSSIVLVIISPVFCLISILVLLTSGSPILFKQKRRGLSGKTFEIVKFRTMIKNASNLQRKYKKLNESDGPAFKIINDPRFTKIGRLLSNVGFDELPQFINVLKGEMSIVGPRPLPIGEARKLSKLQRIREYAKPGITSSWVVNGSHKLSFKKWMELDINYVKSSTFLLDLNIIYMTFCLIWRSSLRQITNH